MVLFQIFVMSVDHINYMQLRHCSQGVRGEDGVEVIDHAELERRRNTVVRARW
jgi:hypothetical protein